MFQRIQESKNEMLSIDYLLYLLWQVLLMALTYLTLVAFFEEDSLPPNGHLYHMFCLFLLSHIFGKIAHIISLPSLFGMLVSGFIYGNLLNINLNTTLKSTIRSIALLIILIRAGLHLSPDYIRKLSFKCFRVIVIPFAVETLTVTLFSYIFFHFDLAWSILNGFVVAAVSPAVIVPCMIRIEKAGISDGKSLSTLNIAAASFNDVLAVTGFNICLSFTDKNQESSLPWKILKGPAQILIGLVFGIASGISLWYLPERFDHCEDRKKNHLSRFSLLLMAGLFAMFGSYYFDIEAAGPLAILTMAFTATIKWRKNGWEKDSEDSLKIIWLLFKRLLFCLIGADLRINEIEMDIMLKVIGCILFGIVAKVFFAYFLSYGIGLDKKKRLFIAISWIPKATVQAAIGPIALSIATEDQIPMANVILTTAALSIIMTAPLGAIIIDYLSSKLLPKPDPNNNNNSNNNNNNNTNHHHHNLDTPSLVSSKSIPIDV